MSDSTLPIKTLPIVERWDCTSCGQCCRGTEIPLDDDDLQQLRRQQWDRHPDYQGVQTVVRQGMLRRRYRLAQRDDGRCVFLTGEGRCRIHEEFGLAAKPLVCRVYPLQLVPLDDVALLTLRRSCPAAAADQGSELRTHRDTAVQAVRQRPQLAQAAPPPPIIGSVRRSWPDTRLVTDALERLLTDEQYPLVRRLAHGLRFCDVFAQCRIRKQDRPQLAELVTLLAEGVRQEVVDLFRERRAPGRAASVLFRQIVADYLRLHPRVSLRESWRERLRLAAAAVAFVRGQGPVPRWGDGFPETTFEALEERKLGHWGVELQQPLQRYFETMAVSLQYAVASRPGWPLIDNFRALAVAYPVALWMLRYACGEREPATEDVIEIITAIDRGQGYAPLIGRQHRRRISQLAALGELERLVIWHAR
ncbi:MAG: YkgJ family cysteine cluster protein [Candidatus Anammoximicrobium sp.]|nr:YkgJ family cysteine cluster protein [Candidatus Anammoximicrobium sp.]